MGLSVSQYLSIHLISFYAIISRFARRPTGLSALQVDHLRRNDLSPEKHTVSVIGRPARACRRIWRVLASQRPSKRPQARHLELHSRTAPRTAVLLPLGRRSGDAENFCADLGG